MVGIETRLADGQAMNWRPPEIPASVVGRASSNNLTYTAGSRRAGERREVQRAEVIGTRSSGRRCSVQAVYTQTLLL